MKYNFLKTSDEETKKYLLNRGYKLVSQDEKVWTFINDHSLTFDNTNNKIQYSNILNV